MEISNLSIVAFTTNRPIHKVEVLPIQPKKKIHRRPMWMEWIPIPNKRCSHLKNTNAFIEYLQWSEWEKLWISKYQHMYIIEE